MTKDEIAKIKRSILRVSKPGPIGNSIISEVAIRHGYSPQIAHALFSGKIDRLRPHHIAMLEMAKMLLKTTRSKDIDDD